jgi:hypothetical protein
MKPHYDCIKAFSETGFTGSDSLKVPEKQLHGLGAALPRVGSLHNRGASFWRLTAALVASALVLSVAIALLAKLGFG